MHDHGVDRGLLQEHHVAREVAGGLLVAHGVAAIFHHDDFLVVALHVRQRLDQDARLGLRVDLLQFRFGSFAHRLGFRLGRRRPFSGRHGSAKEVYPRKARSAAAASASQLAIMTRPPVGAAKGNSRPPR